MRPTLHLGSSIRLIATDFDGIFTDGSIYVNDNMTVSKRLHYLDLMALYHAEKYGIKIAIISGDKSSAIDYIKKRLPNIEVFQDIRVKIDILKELVTKYHLAPEEVVYIGDDINDSMCLEAVKYKVTVPNANWQIKQILNIQITNHLGGNGAFREVFDSIISPQIQ